MQDRTLTSKYSDYLTTKRDIKLAAFRQKQLEMPTTVKREIIIGKYEATEKRMEQLIT